MCVCVCVSVATRDNQIMPKCRNVLGLLHGLGSECSGSVFVRSPVDRTVTHMTGLLAPAD